MDRAEALVLVCAVLGVWVGLDLLVRLALGLIGLSLWTLRGVRSALKGRKKCKAITIRTPIGT